MSYCERMSPMSRSLEIEYKSMLTAEEYQRVKTQLKLSETDFFVQTNHYFDSADWQLRSRQMGLRIRQFPDKAELTLKLPQPTGLLEVTDPLTLTEAQTILTTKHLPAGHVTAELEQQGINPRQLQPIGSLTTKRAEVALPEGLLALDESWYGTEHDYEIELEVTDALSGAQNFQLLLNKWQILKKGAKNKVQRMIEALHPFN